MHQPKTARRPRPPLTWPSCFLRKPPEAWNARRPRWRRGRRDAAGFGGALGQALVYDTSSAQPRDGNPQGKLGKRWRVTLLATALASVSLLLISSLAQAGHYHTYNHITHGLVHGSSDSDGAYFSRTYGYYIAGINYCGVGDYDSGLYAVSYSYSGGLCSLFSYNYSSSTDECRGISYNRVGFQGSDPDYFLRAHYHDAHSPPRYSCRSYPV